MHFIFRQCNNGEELHYTTEREALATVYVLHKFWHCLLRNKFVFYVHHMTFPYFIKKPQVYRMITIWTSLFLECNLLVIYKPRHSHSIANALSRLIDIHYEKKGVLQLALQLTIHTIQFIATQLQLNQNNSFSTIMQLHYNCSHDVMLTSLIVIRLLKSNKWHYEDFWT
jgi:hypothetical protein